MSKVVHADHEPVVTIEVIRTVRETDSYPLARGKFSIGQHVDDRILGALEVGSEITEITVSFTPEDWAKMAKDHYA